MTEARRVLVTFGSKRGGTAEIAVAIAAVMRERGLVADCAAASSVGDLSPYDAVIVGGALYARRWYGSARRFVTRNLRDLRERAVWMFSSGPLDASHADLPPVPRVRALMARVGARGHATFGGRLTPNATGFAAAAMAKTRSGDWRDWDKIRAWAGEVAQEIIAAQPIRIPVERPRRWLLAALCLLVGTTAIAGGLTLVARPDGSLVQLPHTLLEHSPFTSFLIPGLVLLLVIGCGNAIAGTLAIRDSTRANTLGFAGGAALLVWIVTQAILLRTVEGLQVAYALAGIAIMLEARYRRRTGRLALVVAR